MPEIELVIGNKNYSSWSLRPWLLLKHAGIGFKEIRIPLDTERFSAEIGAHSPSRKVPVLKRGDLRVWESLAICEYVAEQFPHSRAWPDDAAARALARAVSLEMHAGFAALRAALPMNCRRRVEGFEPPPHARHDIHRVGEIWRQCLARENRDGPWLFGRFSIADAMYAPVALRFAGYGVTLGPVEDAYVERVLAHAAVAEWVEAAGREPEVIAREEVSAP